MTKIAKKQLKITTLHNNSMVGIILNLSLVNAEMLANNKYM